MKRLVTRFLYGLLVLLLAPGLAMAQEGTITGTVTDAETDEVLPGATVQIAELSIGTATDSEGNYTLDAPAGVHTVSVSFVGFETTEREVEVPADEEITVNFALQVGAEQLGEIVVQGYGVSRRKVESGSIGSVSSEDIETVTARSADGAIQGRIAGARITSTSGQPGAGLQFQIRGSGSITAGSDPLIIVDGVQFSNDSQLGLASGNPLNSINPSDIESIEVLKDASAKAIYGAQAANGVVLITTKQGRDGPTEISFSTQVGAVDRIEEFDVLNSRQFVNNRIEANVNFFVDRQGDNEAARETGRQRAIGLFGDPDSPDLLNTNWQDAVFQTGVTQSHNLSLRGGNEKTTFYVSGRFTRDEGQIIESFFRQGGLRANLEHQASDRISLESKVNLTTTDISGTISDGPFINSPFWAAQFILPTLSIYNEPGNPDSGFNLLEGVSTFNRNPVAQETFNTRESNASQISANVAANVELIPGVLFARTSAGLQHEDTSEEDFRDPRLPNNQATGGTLTSLADRRTSFNVSQSLTFDEVFRDVHAFTGLMGAEYKQESFELTSARGQGFPNFLFRTLQSAAEPTNVNSARSRYRVQSGFINGEYTYDDTYQLRGTVRLDGSSRFGSENRWGTFGTLSGFWRISNESFMDGFGFVDNLLLRGGFGVTGNSEIGNFAARQLFIGSGEYANRPGIRPSSLGNPLLTWEENQETNIGLDFDVLNRRLSGSFDVYRSDRQELLLGRSLPSDSGFGSITENVGEIRNEGVEIELSTLNLDLAGFQWSTDFNIAFERSEVLSLTEDQDEITSGLVFKVGEPVGQYRQPVYAGVNPANGRPMYYDADGELTYSTSAEDEQLVGNLQPDFFGGLTNRFSYGGLSLNVFVQYDYGRTTLNNNAFFSDVSSFNFNSSTRVLDRWQEPGDVTDVPKLFIGGYQDGSSEGVFSTRFIEDASYIRLKEVKLAYQFPTELARRAQLQRASIFVQGENLATLTDFTGPDPEIVGTALGEFPQSRRITVGLNITL